MHVITKLLAENMNDLTIKAYFPLRIVDPAILKRFPEGKYEPIFLPSICDYVWNKGGNHWVFAALLLETQWKGNLVPYVITY